ncbi:hypothetical protein Pyrde_1253 [Pyrodictium delaneyi]|uniref:AAA+ ATPase domain-containing protein n=1 Tax=Pyrodictium delaneyi TaxID=1273541 RepID=A0A0P0N521_9CREN|nr:DUF87 domain-containing protein [Pyrodictium delaneyi]ALL01301.1 hypothetical protein Pyrde_1253 [Pyrodictium delaneyi]
MVHGHARGLGWPLLSTREPWARGAPVGYVLGPGGRRRAVLRAPVDLGHTGILGATGSGKSTTLKALARALARQGASVVILDWEGEHTDTADEALEPSELRASLLGAPDPREAAEALESLLAVLGESYQLSPLMHILLAKTLSTTRRRIHTVLRALEERAESVPARDVRNSIYALQRRLQALRPVLEFLKSGPGKKLDPAEPRPSRVYAVDLSGLPPRSRSLYAHAVAAHLQQHRRPGQDPLLYLAVEEAHNTTAPATPMEQLLLEARKKNTRLILVASHPAPHIHNLHTIIAHRQPGTEPAHRLAEQLAPRPEARTELATLLLNPQRTGSSKNSRSKTSTSRNHNTRLEAQSPAQSDAANIH